MYGYIYKTTNLVNGKIYIGQKKSDVFLGDKYLGSGKILKMAIEKYGKENFSVELLHESLNKLDLDAMEICYIYNYRDMGYSMYNIANGGNGGDTFSNLSKERQDLVRQKHRENSGMKKGSSGYEKRKSTLLNNPEIMINANNLKRGKPAWNKGLTSGTDDRVRKNADSLKNYYKTHESVQKNKPRTEEEKRKISEGMKGKKNGIGNKSTKGYKHVHKGTVNTTVPIDELQYYLDTGWELGNYHKPHELYNARKVLDVYSNITYSSLSDAQRETNVSSYYIKKSCEEGVEYKGKLFKYV